MADSGRPDSTPPEQRIDVGASAVLATPSFRMDALLLPSIDALGQPVSVSPRFATLDLTTLFATLLI